MGAANWLSFSRLLLAPASAYAIVTNQWPLAAAVIAIAIVTDLADGPLARARQETSASGALLDHGSDAIFVSCSLFALSFQQLVPLLLPVLVLSSFAQYVLDSRALSGQHLRSSVLGRYNGIAYFALLPGIVMPPVLLHWHPSVTLVHAVAWLLILSTLISMFDRGWTLLKMRNES